MKTTKKKRLLDTNTAAMPGKTRQDIMVLATRIMMENPMLSLITLHLSLAWAMKRDGGPSCPCCLSDMVADAFVAAADAGIIPKHDIPSDEGSLPNLPKRILEAWEAREMARDAEEEAARVVKH